MKLKVIHEFDLSHVGLGYYRKKLLNPNYPEILGSRSPDAQHSDALGTMGMPGRSGNQRTPPANPEHRKFFPMGQQEIEGTANRRPVPAKIDPEEYAGEYPVDDNGLGKKYRAKREKYFSGLISRRKNDASRKQQSQA